MIARNARRPAIVKIFCEIGYNRLEFQLESSPAMPSTRKLRSFRRLLAVSLAAISSQAAIVTLGSSQDSFVAVGGNFDHFQGGAYPFLTVEPIGASWSGGLVQFDLTSIPGNAVIESATLELFHLFNEEYGMTVSLFPVIEGWNEYEVTGATVPARWSTPVSSLTFFDTTSWVWRSWEVAWIVQQWVSSLVPNHGLYVERSPDPYLYQPYFASKEATEWGLGEGPRLTIVYSSPEATGGPDGGEIFPEETTLSLLSASTPLSENPEPGTLLSVGTVCLAALLSRLGRKRLGSRLQ
jgi:hypothetical protein